MSFHLSFEIHVDHAGEIIYFQEVKLNLHHKLKSETTCTLLAASANISSGKRSRCAMDTFSDVFLLSAFYDDFLSTSSDDFLSNLPMTFCPQLLMTFFPHLLMSFWSHLLMIFCPKILPNYVTNTVCHPLKF